jgi:mono/diheme cytochrome c family protein
METRSDCVSWKIHIVRLGPLNVMKYWAFSFVCAVMLAAVPAHADEGDWRAGRAFAIQNCHECHDVGNGKKLLSGLNGPAFRDVANQAATSPLSLRVFLTSSHPPMPNFILSRTEIDNVIAYILSLRPPVQEKM